jgi:hypothetical protein
LQILAGRVPFAAHDSMLRSSAAASRVSLATGLKLLVSGLAALATLGLTETRASGQVVSDPADINDGSYLLTSSTVYADGGSLFIGGPNTFMDGIQFDLSSLSDETLTNFTISTNSTNQLSLGVTGTIPFGYYIGGFTNSTSGLDLSKEQYVSAGNLNFTVVATAQDSLTGLSFSSPDLTNYIQMGIDNPTLNYGIVFNSQTPALTALFPGRGGQIPSLESGPDGPTSIAVGIPDVPEPKSTVLLVVGTAGLFAAGEALRRKKHYKPG